MDFPQRVNGWALYAHPCFQETYDALVAEVETLKGKDPENYQRKAATKLLAVVHKVIEEHITVNPSSPAFRHGKSLGSGKNKDWSRVKFGAICSLTNPLMTNGLNKFKAISRGIPH